MNAVMDVRNSKTGESVCASTNPDVVNRFLNTLSKRTRDKIIVIEDNGMIFSASAWQDRHIAQYVDQMKEEE